MYLYSYLYISPSRYCCRRRQLPNECSLHRIGALSVLRSVYASLNTSALLRVQIEELHRELRENCDTMGIGLGGDPQGRRRDTVAEDGIAAAAGGKDLGDVKCAHELTALP